MALTVMAAIGTTLSTAGPAATALTGTGHTGTVGIATVAGRAGARTYATTRQNVRRRRGGR
ncbi:hypothetical protein GCM10023191_018350 [Actinoallomurus oryzae]|uniref:Secreted protein n=1 Tax=Actinoallomurus oryzae TaxID=502180 RepID=A0ABP8PLQ8_9ACTN